MSEWGLMVFGLLNAGLFGFIGYRLGRLEAKSGFDRERMAGLNKRVDMTEQRIDILREEMKLELRGQK